MSFNFRSFLSFFCVLLVYRFCHGQDPDLSNEIIVQLGNTDLDAIKSAMICNDKEGLDCFLSFLEDTVRDANNNPLEADPGCLEVTNFTPDQNPPELIRFLLFDMDEGIMVLSFNETIDTLSLNYSALSLHQSFDDTDSAKYTMANSITVLNVNEHSTVLNISLHVDDLNELKRFGSICNTEGNCWVRYLFYFITDVGGNYVKPVDGSVFDITERASEVIDDTTGPIMTDFTVDFDRNLVTFYFNEIVERTSLDFDLIQFTSSNSTVSVNYTLTDGIHRSTSDNTSLTIELVESDVIQLKALDDFFTSEDDTFIVFSNGLIKDWTDVNNIQPRVSGINSLQASLFSPDITPPQHTAFNQLDMNDNSMTISFNEPIDITNVNYSAIILRSSTLSNATEVRLTGAAGISYATADKRTLLIRFNDTDIMTLKSNPLIATASSNSFLTLERGAFYDVFNIPSTPVTSVSVSTFIADTNGPMVSSFILDLDASTLTITFSDIVNVATLLTSEITFQPQRTLADGDPTVTLTDVSSSSPNGYTVMVLLNPNDVNTLNMYPDLATNTSNAYISVTADAINDVYGANVIAVTPSEALRASSVIPDETPPQIDSFSLNFNTEILAINFSETVNLNTLDVTQITIQSSQSSNNISVTLTGGVIVSNQYQTTVDILLTRDDLNDLKISTGLAVSQPTTYLSITNATFRDSNDNPSVEILSTDARLVESFTPDGTSPVLRSAALDLDEGMLTLTFDETVNSTTFNPLLVQIQSEASYPLSHYLLASSVSSTAISTDISISISHSDLNSIKEVLDLATSLDNSYISLGDGVVLDMNGVSFSNVSSVRVSTFINDTTSPTLDSFSLDLNSGIISLTFSETVDSTSIDVSTIQLLAGPDDLFNETVSYSLTPGSLPIGTQTLSSNSSLIIVSLGSTDLNEIKRLSELATEEANTYISITNNTIIDMYGNLVVPRDPEDPLMANLVVRDTTPPTLEEYTLDLDEGLLQLTFSETVNASSLVISSLSLREDPSEAFAYTLTTSSVVSNDSVVLNVSFSDRDLNSIKFLSNIATYFNNSFLRIATNGVRDMNNIQYVENRFFAANPLIPDTTSPEIDEFSLDLNTGILSLTFTEYINSSTLDIPSLVLQGNAYYEANNSLRLSGGTISGTNDMYGHPPVIDIRLLETDLNSVKRLTGLGIEINSTYLSVANGSVQDSSSNLLIGIRTDDAQEAFDLIEDTTPPRLINFYVNLTSETLLLVFDETVNRLSLRASQVQFQSASNSPSLSVSLNESYVISTEDGVEVLIQFSQNDLNAIKLEPFLCTERENCFISLTNDSILDMNNNQLNGIIDTNALIANNVTEDVIEPELVHSTLDLNAGTLLLSFSEPVNVSSLNIADILLLAYPGANDSEVIHRLTPGKAPGLTSTSSQNGLEILLSFGTDDLYVIQQKYLLATQRSNSYLSLADTTVLDMNNNNLTSIPVAGAEMVSLYIDDVLPPELLSFTLNLNNGLLSMTFDETVNASSLRPSFLALRPNENISTPVLVLSSMTPLQSLHWPIINITLTKMDLDTLKVHEDLGTSTADTYLHLMQGAIQDLAKSTYGNEFVATEDQAFAVFNDTTHPEAISMTVNINASMLIISFTEPIDVSEISYVDITLQNSPINATEVYPLTNGSTPSGDGLQVIIMLSSYDLNSIKSFSSLFVSANTSYVSFSSDAFQDMSGNPVVPRPPENPLEASSFDDDTTRPYLTQFQLDMDTGTVTLIFTETVNISSIDFSTIRLSQNSTLDDGTVHTLRGGVLVSDEPSTVVVFNLTDDDLNELKRLEIGLSSVTTHISLTEETIVDMNDNQLVPVTGREVTVFQEDRTSPTIDSFDLDLTNEKLILYFSETVRASTIDVTEFILQDATGDEIYNLTESSVPSREDSTSITIDLGIEDLNAIKLLTDLATEKANTYLSYSSLAVLDMIGLPVVARLSNDPLQVDNYTQDTVAPLLSYFTLDLSNNTLTLTFTESVNSLSLVPTEISIQSEQSFTNDTSYVVLSSVIPSPNSHIIILELNNTDLNDIKAYLDLATTEDNTYITLSSDAIKDMNNNSIDPIFSSFAQEAQRLIPDSVPPQLESFILNLNTSKLLLTFSETVSALSIDFTKIILQDESNSSNSYQFMTGDVSNYNSSVIEVSILKVDSDLIKERLSLATERDNTYLRFLDGAINDMNNNKIAEIENGFAERASDYIEDRINPELVDYQFDLDTGRIILTFSEPVLVTTINFTDLVLQDSIEANITLRLADGDSTERNFTEVNITLTTSDLNTIKQDLSLATVIDNTFLSFTSLFVTDTSGNPIIPDDAKQAIEVSPDITGPIMTGFDLNLTSDILTLTFNEPVSVSTFNTESLTLYDSPSGLINYTLQSSYIGIDRDDTVVYVYLSTEDVNEVKRLSLATSPDDTYLSIDSLGFNDTSGNRVIPSPPLNVTVYGVDFKMPYVLSFTFNLSSGDIVLTFSETVNASSIDISGFSLQSDSYVNYTDVAPLQFYTLTNASYASEANSHIITITVSGSDLNRLKYDPFLAVSNETTFLLVESGSILDMAGNPVIPILNNDSLAVDTFTSDFIPPVLEAFNLYLAPGSNTLILELVFSETVNSSSLNTSAITFSPSSVAGNITYTLTGGSVSPEDSTIITVTISPTDLEAIRQLDQYQLLTTPHTSYISIDQELVVDMTGNPVISIPLDDALNISGPHADLNPPDITRFSFDANTGSLRLTFDEVILPHSLNASRLTLHSNQFVVYNSSLGESHTLTGYADSTSDGNGNVVLITLTDDDLNEVKRLSQLATSIDSTYLTFERGLLLDESLNEAVVLSSPIKASEYTRDVTSPMLLSYNVSLETGLITLLFNETIDSSTVNVNLFTLQNSINSADKSYSLTDSSILTTDSIYLTIQLSYTDINAIKAIDGLATNRNDTFIVIDREALMDMAGNELKEVFNTNAELVTDYQADINRPSLDSYTFDLNTGTLLLTFNETVRETTLDTTELTFFDFYGANATINYTLTASFSNSNSNPILNISFSLIDLNEIKRLPLCTSRDDCYLSFSEDLVHDMVSMPVLPEEYVQPDPFINDTTSPALLLFSVLDFDREILVLQFSETLNLATINFTSLVLKNFYMSPLGIVNITGGDIPDVNTSTLNISLTDDDIDSLKLAPYVCTYIGNCYVDFGDSFIEDMNGNQISPVLDTAPGFIVQSYQADTIKPELVAFDLDLLNGLLYLQFSEPVDIGSIRISDVTLQGADNVTDEETDLLYSLTGYTSITRYDSRTLLVALTPSDVENIKSSVYFKDINSTYLSIAANTVQDLSFISNYNDDMDPIQVRDFTADADGPRMLGFTLDYDSNTLILTFNKPVLPETFNFSQITIESSPPTGPYLRLTGGTVLNPPSESGEGIMLVTVNITLDDMTTLESDPSLATKESNTSMFIENDTVSDTFSVPSIAQSNISANFIIPDTTRPELISFSLDMNTGVLGLYFNDVVDSSSFKGSGLVIQNDTYATDEYRVSLTDDTVTISPNGFSIDVMIGFDDLNRLKAQSLTADSKTTTWLTMQAATIDDPFGVDVLAITNGKAILVSGFELDTTPPSLQNFTLDLNQGIVTLTFSEAVVASSLDVFGLTLLNNESDFTHFHIFNSSSVNARSLTEVDIVLLNDNLNTLKKNLVLGTDRTNSYLTIDDGSILDYANNGVYEINNTEAIQAQSVIPDTTRPALVSFSLDMNTGIMELSFNETVLGSSLDGSMVYLQGVMIYRTGMSAQLANTDPSTDISDVINVHISDTDLNIIKQLTGVAIDVYSTFIVIGDNAINDTSGNPALRIPDTIAKRVLKYTRDSNPPSLVSSVFNVSSDSLILTFNETVNATSIDVGEITVYSSYNATDGVQLTGGIIESPNDTSITIVLTRSDLNILKADPTIATSSNDTFLSLTTAILTDMSGNRLVPINYDPVDVFIVDLVPPQLEGFTYNAHDSVLTLTFSETVDGTTLNTTGIVLQSSNIEPFTSYRLTSGYTDTVASPIINITLDADDTNVIKSLLDLATNLYDTYISIDSTVIDDMNGNPAVPLLPSSALLASVYVKDEVPPSLLYFSLDMNASQLILTFSETMDSSSVNITGFTLQDSQSMNATLVTLTTGTVSTIDSTNIIIYLSKGDANTIKSYPYLATYINDTFLSITSYSISDIDGNTVESIIEENALLATGYTHDETDPQLEDFVLDMDEGILTLIFDETVNSSSIDINILIQSSPNVSHSDYYRLTNGIVETDLYSTHIPITIPTPTLNEIKDIPLLAQSVNDTYISFESSLIQDMNNNSVIGISSESGQQSGRVIPDTTSPNLLSFDLNMDSNLLILYFDEVVNVDSVDITTLTLLNSSVEPQSSYTIRDGATSFDNSTIIEVFIMDSDLNAIKLDRFLATSINDTFLSISSSTAQDMAELPNDVVPTVINVSNFTEDTTRPTLSYWSVDVNEGLITLVFDETVDRSTLNFTALTVQSVFNATSNESEYYTLTTGESPSTDGLSIEVIINNTDLNVIKQYLNLLRDRNSSYLSFTQYLIKDMNGNPVEEKLLSEGEGVTVYVNDSTAPRLREFWLDMDAGIITFSFSETIDASSYNASGLTLQSVFNITHSYQAYTFTGGLVTTVDGPILAINITRDDLNELKRLEIARGPYRTFLDLSPDFISDIEGHQIIPLVNGINARMIINVNHIRDLTGPYLENFDIDLTRDILTLYFDETVRTSTVNVTQITLQSTSVSDAVSYKLTVDSAVITDGNYHTVDILLGNNDLNNIKRMTQLATYENDTYLSHTIFLVNDMRNNPSFSIESDSAIKVLNYTQDIVRPALV
uniref:Uncharacterized protein n=1 Tax=Amphimedon queenslandica TaxID=400682 RepID=A0A1X7V1F8_AMPQE